MSADLADYPDLKKYAILVTSGITSVSALTVTDGSYASDPTIIYPLNITGNLDQADAVNGQKDLSDLVININALSVDYTNVPLTVGDDMTFTPGVYSISSGIAISATKNIIFDAQGVPANTFYIIAPGITLQDVLTIELMNGALASNIYWLSSLDFTIFGTTVPSIMNGVIISEANVLFSKGLSVNGPVYVRDGRVDFIGADYSTVNGFFSEPIPCFVKGTKILTENGYVPVENLKNGDMLVAKGKIRNNHHPRVQRSIKPITNIITFSVSSRFRETCPIRIAKHTFGKNAPFKDLFVSPNHGIIVKGNMMAPRFLVNNSTITQNCSNDIVTYYHIELESHEAIIANGLLSDSFLSHDEKVVNETERAQTQSIC